ncbi:IS4 family transposase [Clostridium sp. OS1-26]|uniref:IS4 family transposase n=1 Tax=Clostridium sp. OS1-26 TaxID=3070681 RepID=UPI0027E04864|nr:IS4 family transposase [Clostridium sp. OS1-26]WML34067.1 IS4 family transposase [Clostridium sp. OS1-26]
MLKNNNKLVFHKLIAEIGGDFVTRTIEKYNGDYRSQHFDTRSHINSMLYLNIKNCKSLRELESELSSNRKTKSLINVPSVSQFSRKNTSRDYRIFEDIFYHLVKKAKRRFGAVRLLKDIAPIKIIDSTVILVALKLAPHLQMDNERAGIKVSTLFNGKYPEKINIVKGQVNDRKCIDGLFEDKECIYVFDRGYYDYRWYDRLTEQGIKFVTRGIKNVIIMEERIIDSKPLKDIYDTEVVLGSTPGGNLTFSNYREIMTFDENGEPVTFVTNIFDLSTEDIISIYKHRWEIELFFKWIKQNLRIKKYIGYNENAIKIQLFSALIAYMLIYLCCSINVAKYSMLTLTRIVRSNLLEVIDDSLTKYFRTS